LERSTAELSRCAASGEAVVRLQNDEPLAVAARISPLTTGLASIFEVLAGWRRGAPESWVRHVCDRLRGERLGELVVYTVKGRTVPEFLAPVPTRPRASIEDELADLGSTAPERVRGEIEQEFGHQPPPELRPFVSDPDAALARLTATLRRYWDLVFADKWPEIERLLEHEIAALGGALVTEGPAALLARLAPTVALSDGELHWRSAEPGRTNLAGRRLILVPMLAGQDASMSNHLTAADVLIAYPVPGAAVIWGSADACAGEPLSAVLGESRARVMLSVQTVATTTDLADQLGLSAATISHHLSALREQGLVEAERYGRHVYYRMTMRGRRLRDALTET
jgi:DNA-binding transcriptional ArsR family regulator